MTMDSERVDIAPAFSFKPVDDDVSSIASSQDDDSLLNPGQSPSMDIFRPGRDTTSIDEKQRSSATASDNDNDEAMDDASAARRVISPYPFSHASREEIAEREQLTNDLSWTLTTDNFTCITKQLIAADYDYKCIFGKLADAVMNEGCCDEFSVSTHDADSLSGDLDLRNPASFWEEGASTIPTSIIIVERTKSPTEVSLGSDGESPSLPVA